MHRDALRRNNQVTRLQKIYRENNESHIICIGFPFTPLQFDAQPIVRVALEPVNIGTVRLLSVEICSYAGWSGLSSVLVGAVSSSCRLFKVIRVRVIKSCHYHCGCGWICEFSCFNVTYLLLADLCESVSPFCCG